MYKYKEDLLVENNSFTTADMIVQLILHLC